MSLLTPAPAMQLQSGAPEEARWLRRVALGDTIALEHLYTRCAPKALGVAMRILQDRADAEEVLQETFLEIWRRARDFNPQRGSVLTWISVIARTRAIDRLRSRTAASAQRAPELAPPAEPTAPQEREAEDRQSLQQLTVALEGLPLPQRQVVELSYLEGITLREIARRLAAPEGTVKSRLQLGIRRLSKLIGSR